MPSPTIPMTPMSGGSSTNSTSWVVGPRVGFLGTVVDVPARICRALGCTCPRALTSPRTNSSCENLVTLCYALLGAAPWLSCFESLKVSSQGGAQALRMSLWSQSTSLILTDLERNPFNVHLNPVGLEMQWHIRMNQASFTWLVHRTQENLLSLCTSRACAETSSTVPIGTSRT